MLAVVKKHHTKQPLFEIRGDIPAKVVRYLKDEFGQDVEVPQDDEETVNIFDTEWYKEIGTATTPGETMKIYRENAKLTQEELGRKLGNFSRQEISDMERGARNISRPVAKELSNIFQVPIIRFL